MVKRSKYMDIDYGHITVHKMNSDGHEVVQEVQMLYHQQVVADLKVDQAALEDEVK